MKNWIKKNRDAILAIGGATIATAVVAGVTYKITSDTYGNLSKHNATLMSLIASDAGVLDQIIAHQEKLNSINK